MTADAHARWKATITYRTRNGPRTEIHHIEELYEIHDIVELGPDWNALEDIRIVLARRSQPQNYTVEYAAGGSAGVS